MEMSTLKTLIEKCIDDIKIETLTQGNGFVVFGNGKEETFDEDDIKIFKNIYNGRKLPPEINKNAFKYRYFYYKKINKKKKLLIFVLLNPSTADENKSDPTIKNCQKFTEKQKDYGGFAVVNLFALRAPRPKILKEIKFETTKNNEFLGTIFESTDLDPDIVIAWGMNKKYPNDKEKLLNIIKSSGRSLYTLRAENETRHPANQAWSRVKCENGKCGFDNAELYPYPYNLK